MALLLLRRSSLLRLYSSQCDPGTAPKAVKRQVHNCCIVDVSVQLFYQAELMHRSLVPVL